MSVIIRTSQNVALEYQPASIGDRILATLIDYLVFLGWILLTLGLPASLNINLGEFYAVLVLAPLFFYDLLCEYFLNGRSLGKLALGTRVVMLDGSQPRLGGYLLRWVLRLVESMAFFWGIVPIVTVAVNGKGQRLGDIAAGTSVVKLKPPVSLNEVLPRPMPEAYVVQFPDVRLLTDRDISVVREVLQRGDSETHERTAEKIREVTGIQSSLGPRAFLETVLTDYLFVTTQ